MKKQKREKKVQPWEEPFSFPAGDPGEEEESIPRFSAFTLQDHDPLTVPYPDDPEDLLTESPEDEGPELPEPVTPSRVPQRKNSSSLKASPPWKALLLFAALLTVSFGALIAGYRAPYQAFRAGADRLKSQTFFDGITVDDVPVSGMTLEQAEAMLNSRPSGDQKDGIHLTIRVGDSTAVLTSKDISLDSRRLDTLRQAYTVGRGWDDGVLDQSSPFAMRLSAVQQAAEQDRAFSSVAGYDPQDIANYVRALAAQTDVPAVNAGLTHMDFVHRVFYYTDDRNGVALDQEDLTDKIRQALDNGQLDQTLTARLKTVYPAVRKTDLMNKFGLMNVRSFATSTPSGDGSLKKLVSALNGAVISSGSTFSVLALLRQAGCSPDDPGMSGLLTQLSSALMDGGICAGMTLDTRFPLDEPSALIPPGTEAAVSAQQDMILRNETPAPYCVLCYYVPRTSTGTSGDITLEWYGITLSAGEERTITAELTGTVSPGEPLRTLNEDLPKGRQVLVQEERNGETWTCSLIKSHSGREYQRTVLFTTVYPPVQRHIEYND